MLETWCSAVLRLMYRAAAICGLVKPAATSRSTSTSRSLSPEGCADLRLAAPPRRDPDTALSQLTHDGGGCRCGTETLERRQRLAERRRVAGVGQRARRLVRAPDPAEPGRRGEVVATRPVDEWPDDALGERDFMPGSPQPHRQLTHRDHVTTLGGELERALQERHVRFQVAFEPARLGAGDCRRPQSLEMSDRVGDLERLVERWPHVVAPATGTQPPNVFSATKRM